MGHKERSEDGKTFTKCYTIPLKLWHEFYVNFVLLYFSSYWSIKIWHLLFKNVEKKAIRWCIIFLCRMYLSMYFSPKKVFCLICWIFFCFGTWIQDAFCPSRGNKNPHGSDAKTLCISIGKELFIKPYKCFWYKPSHSSSLIGCYNAI